MRTRHFLLSLLAIVHLTIASITCKGHECSLNFFDEEERIRIGPRVSSARVVEPFPGPDAAIFSHINNTITNAFKEARNSIDTLFRDTEPMLITNINPLYQMKIPTTFWAAHTQSDSFAHQRSYAAHVAIAASKKLLSDNVELTESAAQVLDEIERFCPLKSIECGSSKYRTIDGTCNNVKHPTWGANYAPMQRILKPVYSDGISEIRVSFVDGIPLPNVRLLSNMFFGEADRKPLKVNMLVTHWAHFIYTDLVHIGSTQLSQGNKQIPLPCCSSGRMHPECMPIIIDADDPRYGGFLNCMPYARTVVAPRPYCALGPREQANQATSYLDGSVIYGSTSNRGNILRTFRDGQLLTSTESVNGNMPPTSQSIDSSLVGSSSCASNGGKVCFLSGTEHVNFLPSVATMHTIWIRQHNRIATHLLTLNPKWTDEQLFEESRRIVVAQLQHITYNEFLPIVVGRENWMKYGLQSQPNGFSDSYSLNVDASVINSYAAVVGQFFYTIFESRMAQYDDRGIRMSERPLNDYFYDPASLYFNERIEGILRYLLREPIHRPGLYMTDEFRDKLFKGAGNLGLDLAAFILQTGRDHGIPPYTAWRERCGSGKVTSFDYLVGDVVGGAETIRHLERAFKHVEDVDLFILGLAEKPLRGALVGPTFSCIISLQFQKTKRGDRFWYENDLSPSGFTEEQLIEIKKTTMAQVICENIDRMEQVQPMAFQMSDSYDNYPLFCNNSLLAGPDFSKWRDDSPKVEMPITPASLEKALALGKLEVEERHKREERNIRRNQQHFKSGDPLLSYGKMMRAKRHAIEMAKVSDVLLETTKILMLGGGLDKGEKLPLHLDLPTLQRLLPQIDVSTFVGNFTAFLGSGGSVDKCLPKNLPCDHTTPYRTASGWCNNLRNPHFANAFGPLLHLLPPAYEDGIDAPRSLSVKGVPLPSARVISNTIHFDQPFNHVKFSLMLMQFGQFLDHDITHSPTERGPDDEILNCTRCDSPKTISVHCMPLPVPEDDPHFPTHDENGEQRCLPFARSLLGQLTLGYRNQLNQLTSYIDGSVVYGSTECEAAELRMFEGGRLNSTNLGSHNPEALPQGDQEQDCRSGPKHPCFVAGDERNSHQPGLTTIHNIFLREHNRIARQLEALNPFWDDEKIYQETRRIVSAEIQHIVYNEFIPKLLGNSMIAEYNLAPLKDGYFTGYDPTCDASISHPFATAAFRFGHTLVRRFLNRYDMLYRNHTAPVDLVENFNSVEAIYDEHKGGIDSLLVGLLGTPTMAFDRFVTNALRNHLFGRRGEPLSGMDLISLNILRARDHGVQPYNAFREFCGLRRAHRFEDLTTEMDETAIAALRNVYLSVEDIDLFPGLLSERPMKGALMPPTMACIIAEQFQRSKKCDRFFYENDLAETKFTKDQLNEIRKISLGGILCANAPTLMKIQPDVFALPDELVNAQVPCEDFPSLDLSKWIDRPVCYIGKEEIPRGRTKRRSPCQSCTCTANGPKCSTITVGNCDKLLDMFMFADIIEDTACIVQCAPMINKRAGRL